MANTLRIKRRASGGAAGAPTTLQCVNAELAFSEVDGVLYYGKGGDATASTSVIAIGVEFGTGVAAFLKTPSSANLATALSDETGTSSVVFSNSPTLVTPNIGTPSAGTLTSCTGLPISSGVSGLGTNVATFLATPSSANLISAITDETGSGSLVFATSPTLVTPTLGVASATTINKVTFTAPATGSTLTIADGKTLTASNTLTFTGTDTSSVAFGAGGTVAYVGSSNAFTGANTFTNATGQTFRQASGNDSIIIQGRAGGVASYAATFTTATLTASRTLTLPDETGTVLTSAAKISAHASTTSSELASVISDETGTGKLVFATSPDFTTGVTTASATFAVFNTNATSVSAFGAATTLSVGAGSGTTTINNDLTVSGNLTVSGTTTTVNSTTLTVSDKNIEIGKVVTPTNTTADGGGITLKGATDKTFNWVNATTAWTSSEHVDLASGKAYYIAGTSVLSGTTLGSGVTGSSLTSVGTIGTGTWQATAVAVLYGGTGATTASGARTNLSAAGTGDSNAFTGANTFTNATGQTFRQASTNDSIIIQGRAGGISSYSATFTTATLTASRTITIPDATGTLLTTGNVCSAIADCTLDGGTF